MFLLANSEQGLDDDIERIEGGATVESSWGAIKSELRRVVGKPTFELWFEPLRPVGCVAKTLYLTGPDHVITWVERRYSGLLESIGDQVGSIEVRLTDDLAVGDQRFSTPSDERGLRVERKSRPEPKGFETFIVGQSNRLAHGAALVVAEAPGEAYNPLFLHGPPGLGKSHLLEAIANYVAATRPELRVVMTNAETFTREFVSSIQSRSLDAFKRKHREADVLLIDDVQFLEGKARTADELFHTFDSLHGSGGQLVFSADRVPGELSTLEQRLRERFEWGLTVELSEPDRPTREAFLRKMVSGDSSDLDPRLIERIASRPTASMRAVEGTLTRLRAVASIEGLEPDSGEMIEMVEELTGDPGHRKVVSVDEIQRLVSERFGISVEEMLSTGRSTRLSRPRQIAMHLTRQLTGLSLPAIARAFQRRDHTTVMHALKSVEKRIESDPPTRSVLVELAGALRGENGSDRTNWQNRSPQQDGNPQPHYNSERTDIEGVS